MFVLVGAFHSREVSGKAGAADEKNVHPLSVLFEDGGKKRTTIYHQMGGRGGLSLGC